MIHGTIVAFSQGPNIWPMFFFGFAGILVVTQMHGIQLSKKLRSVIVLLYLAGVTWVYSGRGTDELEEVARIPIGEYVLVLILALILGGGLLIYNLATGRSILRKGSES